MRICRFTLKDIFICLALTIALFEVWGWATDPEILPNLNNASENSLGYAYHPRLGWYPLPGSSKYVKAATRTFVRHNSEGLRDAEWGEKTKPRLVFLGDSFVWGEDVEAEQRFTNLLQPLVPDWQIINVGVAGYGTDQELLLLQDLYPRLKPDIVFLIFTGTNDFEGNSTNLSYGFYKPYYKTGGERLELAGVPVPRSVHSRLGSVPVIFDLSYFARFLALLVSSASDRGKIVVPDPSKSLVEMLQSFVEKQGGRFLLGFENTTPEFRTELAGAGVFTVDLITALRYPTHATHWTPEGHLWVTNKICETFASQRFQEGYGPNAPRCNQR